MISAGASHTCARAAFDQIVCWGNNRNGSLGDDTLIRRETPVTVVGNTGGAQLTAGKSFTCARRNTGEVLCWGGNSFGQLGDGSNMNRAAPTRVLGIADATQIEAGTDHICARRANGSVLCWGSNSRGQLGDMTNVHRSTPVAVTGLTDAMLLTAGGEHNCALRATGAVVCWGKNETGQLGVDRVNRMWSMPVTPTGAALVDVQSLSAGEDHTCARLALTLSGRPPILCWGSNRFGQLGDGTRGTDRHTPAAAINLADGVDVVASDTFTCARPLEQHRRLLGQRQRGQDRQRSLRRTALRHDGHLALGRARAEPGGATSRALVARPAPSRAGAATTRDSSA
jgi:alpha-tubulin suppressor-like RCC1 family protein